MEKYRTIQASVPNVPSATVHKELLKRIRVPFIKFGKWSVYAHNIFLFRRMYLRHRWTPFVWIAVRYPFVIWKWVANRLPRKVVAWVLVRVIDELYDRTDDGGIRDVPMDVIDAFHKWNGVKS